MAKEYIEREAALTKLEDIGFYDDEPIQTRNSALKIIQNIPAADVRPVVRGRWLTQEYMYGDKSVGIDDAWIERVAEKGECAYCSNCKEYAKLDGDEEPALTPYCPNCGADMRTREELESLNYIPPWERSGVDDG